MNKYFCCVGRDIAGSIDKYSNPLLSGDYDINRLKSTFVFKSQSRCSTLVIQLLELYLQKVLGTITFPAAS